MPALDCDLPAAAMPVDLTFTDATIARLGPAPEAVIPVLQALQEHYGYLPEEALRRVCASTRIHPSSVTGIASFYDMFRLKPVGKYIVRVCRGTACHVTGAERVEDALRHRLRIPAGDDTDPDRQYTIEPVACLGCCTLAPVVRIESQTFGYAHPEKVEQVLRDFHEHLTHDLGTVATEQPHEHPEDLAEIKVGLGSCCMAKGSDRLFAALQQAVVDTGARAVVKRVGCVGMCHQTPLIEVAGAGRGGTFYAGLKPDAAASLVRRHFRPRNLVRRVSRLVTGALDGLLRDDAPEARVESHALDVQAPAVTAFLGRQTHIASEHFGNLDPLNLTEYLNHQGFTALRQCLKRLPPDEIIATVERSGVRGRGGAGFPTGQKWRVVRQQTGDRKHVICNGDEGDPGAFMDRMLLESFPYRIIEGMAIAAVAVGAHDGVFYIRHEYPLAVSRVRAALEELQRRGWIGEKLIGFDYPFRLSIMEGAGAFVCGEETALIASIEGRRGMPRLRPPFPAQSGLWGQPTLINNVETFALIPWIFRHGAERFAALGTASSKGTKVFALAGKVQRGGLIEVPMGTTIREIVEDIGGGAAPGRRFKAVQIGGPSGGCVPARLADTPVDYESLRRVGAIMGSGGLVVLDDTDCMVDIARYFLQFTQDQSCGKCTFCRVGTRRLLDLLERICGGKGTRPHLDELERLSAQVSAGSLCGLGKTAPNPVVTSLRYFRDEYEAHLQGRCPARKCTALIKYTINDRCTGCTLCAQRCPVDAIPLVPYARHAIAQDLCTRCDTCRQVCPHGAVDVA